MSLQGVHGRSGFQETERPKCQQKIILKTGLCQRHREGDGWALPDGPLPSRKQVLGLPSGLTQQVSWDCVDSEGKRPRHPGWTNNLQESPSSPSQGGCVLHRCHCHSYWDPEETGERVCWGRDRVHIFQGQHQVPVLAPP